MHDFNQSLSYDQRMHDADIRGSIAYAKALTLVRILTQEEEVKITEGLRVVGQEWKEGIVRSRIINFSPLDETYPVNFQFVVQPDDEDIHTANERRLSELIGPLGGKLHTGRSRNDQCATDMRLWLLGEVLDIEKSVKGLIRVMVDRAEQELDILMPGYTHLQASSVFC
jgi:argininosuccinate lyase